MSGGENPPRPWASVGRLSRAWRGGRRGDRGEAGGGDFLQLRSSPPTLPLPPPVGLGGAPGPSPPSSHHGDLDHGVQAALSQPRAGASPDPTPGGAGPA